MNPASDDSVLAADEEYTLWLHSRKRLFGGAQYWRALQEFMLGAAEGPTEEVRSSAATRAITHASPASNRARFHGASIRDALASTPTPPA
jgi:hypothetical protein